MKNVPVALAVVLILQSCHKSTTAPSSPDNTILDSVIQSLASKPLYVSVAADSANTFFGNSGTRYIFPASCFVNGTGAVVTGKVQIEVTEYLQKGDMIYSSMLPVCNSEPLLSGGEISVSAAQNGQPLYMRPGYAFQANLPQGATGTPPAGMSLFFPMDSRNQQNASLFTGLWRNADTSSGSVAYNGDTVSILSDSLQECNADAFMPNPDYQQFSVEASIPGISISSSYPMLGFVLFDNFKAVWPLGITGSYSSGVYSERHVPKIPVHIVMLTVINNKFYGGVLPATPLNGQRYLVTLTQVDAAAFKQQLNSIK